MNPVVQIWTSITVEWVDVFCLQKVEKKINQGSSQFPVHGGKLPHEQFLPSTRESNTFHLILASQNHFCSNDAIDWGGRVTREKNQHKTSHAWIQVDHCIKTSIHRGPANSNTNFTACNFGQSRHQLDGLWYNRRIPETLLVTFFVFVVGSSDPQNPDNAKAVVRTIEILRRKEDSLWGTLCHRGKFWSLCRRTGLICYCRKHTNHCL